MSDLIKKAVYFGLGMTLAGKEKIDQFVDELVRKGDLAPSESRELAARLIEKGEAEQERIRRLVREQLQKLLGELNVATGQDIDRLERRLRALESERSE